MDLQMDAAWDTKRCSLSALKEGQQAQIQEIDAKGTLAERFGDLGLHTGVVLTCVRKSFLGDPVAYGIGGSDTVVAIRNQDAKGILVSVFREEVRDKPWD